MKIIQHRKIAPHNRFALNSLMFKASHGLLFFIIIIMFSGVFQYIAVLISPLILYLAYVITIGCLAILAYSGTFSLKHFVPTAPYISWFVFYLAWGLLVSDDRVKVLPEVTRVFFRNIVIIAAITALLKNKEQLIRLGYLIQITAIANFAICIFQYLDPRLLVNMIHIQNPNSNAFNELRPGGLWGNPNEAVFAFIFALLLSFTCHGTLAWLGRLSALGGIYLTASRSGIYILIVLILIALLSKLKSIHFWIGLYTVTTFFLIIILLQTALVKSDSVLGSFNVTSNYVIQRWLDPIEAERQDIDRARLATIALQYVINAPWYGLGVFTFQLAGIGKFGQAHEVGTHNIYLAVWGETGVLGIAGYILVLGIGGYRVFNSKLQHTQYLLISLMWIGYLLIGFVWHNQLTAIAGAIYVGFLYQIPYIEDSTRNIEDSTRNIEDSTRTLSKRLKLERHQKLKLSTIKIGT